MKDMRLTRFAIVSIILAIFVLFPATSNSAPSRKPIKFYCNLIKKSKILFWNYETPRSVQIDIFDSNMDGHYDTYKWWEDGAVRHKGDFYPGGADTICEDRVGRMAKRNLVAYYSDNDDEYFIKIKSKKDNSNIGHFIIDHEFKKDLKFERYYVSPIDGTFFVSSLPTKVPTHDRIFWNFRFDRKKNKLRKSGFYLWYNFKEAYIKDPNYEEHELLISDHDKDGICDVYLYKVDHSPVFFIFEFLTNISSQTLWNKFRYEILNNGIGYVEYYDSVFSIPLYSKRDKKVIGYLKITPSNNFTMTYCDIVSFVDPYASTAAKFGLCHPSTPYFEFTSFAGREPGFLDPHLRRYRSNVFINEYLKKRERASQNSQGVDVFSLAGDL